MIKLSLSISKPPSLDEKDLVETISKQTGIDVETINKVLNAELDYLKQKGIAR